MLKIEWSAGIRCKTNFMMAESSEDLSYFEHIVELHQDELDSIFEVIDQDLVSDVVEETNDSDITRLTLSCHFCNKKCLSSRGLTRHTNSKHSDALSSHSNALKEIINPENQKKYLILNIFKYI